MHRAFLRYINSIVLLATLFPVQLFAAEFNPNMVISDEQMQDWHSLNRVQIQLFLQERGGYIAQLKTPDYQGMERTASDIIYQAAKTYQINPKSLMVLLQREMSLVTDPDPTQRQLDWAMGYGVCDACDTDDPKIQKYRGFGTQVDNAAALMRWYYDNVNSQNWIKKPQTTYSIDDQSVTPASYATAFLYTYTPHIHGNKNFWVLWKDWFEQMYPNGTLVKLQNAPEIYLLQDGKLRHFKTMTAFVTRGYNPNHIVTISSTEFDRYTRGPDISFPNYSILKDGSTYYLIDYDYIRPFESYDVVKQLGYHPDEIIEVTPQDIRNFTLGTTITSKDTQPLGRIVQTKETKDLYFIKDNVRHKIYDKRIAAINFPNLAIEQVPSADVQAFEIDTPVIPKDGTLIGFNGSPRIYVVEKGLVRHIATQAVFNAYGYKFENVIWTDARLKDFMPEGEALHEPTTTDNSSPSTILTNSTSNNTQPSVSSQQPPQTESNTSEETTGPVSMMVRTPSQQLSYVGPQFSTDMEAYLVADYETGALLAGKNIDIPRPIASLTKLMTAYRLFQEGINLNGETTYNSARHSTQYNYYRVVDGEIVQNRDLLYALLSTSINEPANMLVDTITSGQTSAFVNRMNSQAKDWGLSKTTFVEPTGLSEKNVASPRDMLTIFTYAVQNKSIEKILATKSFEYDEIKDIDGKPHHAGTHSNKLLNRSDLGYTILASKTGFLYESGPCLAMVIQRPSDHKKFFIITMGNPTFDANARFEAPHNLTTWVLKTF